jgi:hypothetical protein
VGYSKRIGCCKQLLIPVTHDHSKIICWLAEETLWINKDIARLSSSTWGTYQKRVRWMGVSMYDEASLGVKSIQAPARELQGPRDNVLRAWRVRAAREAKRGARSQT